MWIVINGQYYNLDNVLSVRFHKDRQRVLIIDGTGENEWLQVNDKDFKTIQETMKGLLEAEAVES